MKTILTQNLFTRVVRFAACTVLAIGLNATALVGGDPYPR